MVPADLPASPGARVSRAVALRVAAPTRRSLAIALCAVLGGVAVARAETGLVAVGPDFEIVPAAPTSSIPSACALSSGGFVVVRSDDAGADARVLGRRIDADGAPVGSEFVVNAYTGSGAVEPDVACDSNGGFAIVWRETLPLAVENDNALDQDVLGRVYAAQGGVSGQVFRVNDYTTGNQAVPSACAQSNGHFAVVWNDKRRDEIDTAVVTAAGRAGGSGKAGADPRPAPPDIGCAGDGSYIVVWGSYGGPSINDEVSARVYNDDGSAASAEFTVNAISTGDQSYPVACGSADGDFIVSWQNGGSSAGPSVLKAREVTLGGNPSGGGFDISPGGRKRGQVACGSSNAFVITSRAPDGDKDVLYAQAVDGDHNLLGPEVVVHRGKTSLGENAPAVAGRSGRYLVAWPNVTESGSISVRGRLFEIGEVKPTTTTLAPPSTTSTTVATPTTTTLAGPTTTLPSGDVCGDADHSGDGQGAPNITVVDALTALRTALGSSQCPACRCDVDGSGSISAADALRILQRAVGLPTALSCPSCS